MNNPTISETAQKAVISNLITVATSALKRLNAPSDTMRALEDGDLEHVDWWINQQSLEAGTKLSHELVERGKERVALLEARAAIIHALRVYNTNRLANAGTDEWTQATVQPLLCFMGWENRTQDLSQLLSETK